jgi:hypothetical protein
MVYLPSRQLNHDNTTLATRANNTSQNQSRKDLSTYVGIAGAVLVLFGLAIVVLKYRAGRKRNISSSRVTAGTTQATPNRPVAAGGRDEPQPPPPYSGLLGLTQQEAWAQIQVTRSASPSESQPRVLSAVGDRVPLVSFPSSFSSTTGSGPENQHLNGVERYSFLVNKIAMSREGHLAVESGPDVPEIPRVVPPAYTPQ